MTQKEQELFIGELFKKMTSTMLSKSKDYANVETDVLSNFKLAGSISGLNAELNCLSLISTKVARLGVLLNSKSKPNNESIQDSILDLANYSILLSMILSEREEEYHIEMVKEPILITKTLVDLREMCGRGDEMISGVFVFGRLQDAIDILNYNGYETEKVNNFIVVNEGYIVESKKIPTKQKEAAYYTFDVLKELCEAGGTEIKGNFVLLNPKLATDLLKEYGYFSDCLTIQSLGKKNRFLIETKKMQ